MCPFGWGPSSVYHLMLTESLGMIFFDIKVSEIIHISKGNLNFFFLKRNQNSIYYSTIRKKML